MNLIADPILALSDGDRVSLPGLFAAMSRNEVRGFPALRSHQRPAWHMFCAQLGALALNAANRLELPDSEAEWAACLRNLTPDHPDDAPWRLVVEDHRKPAFMQPPDPGGLKWSPVETPDQLDMLITSRNHDLKQGVAVGAGAEHWVLALVSLQTSEGYGGRGNHGIARMNGGASSRPLLGLSPARNGEMVVDPSRWWARDVRRLMKARADSRSETVGITGGPALLWCLEWEEGGQLDIQALDPWFIEVCRRVRLTCSGGVLSAVRANSRKPRTDARAFRGVVGDPWAPVHKSEGKSFTIGPGDMNYTQLCKLLFSGEWERALLAQAGDAERGNMVLVAEALSRGNSKTEGFKSRVVPVPEAVVPFFSSETTATCAKAQMDEIAGFDAALRNALALVAAGGHRNKIERKHYSFARPAQKRFDRAADRMFFRNLWRRVAVASSGDDEVFDAKRTFLAELMAAAEAELCVALPAVPCPTMFRPRAEARARRAFVGKLRRTDVCRELFVGERSDVVG